MTDQASSPSTSSSQSPRECPAAGPCASVVSAGLRTGGDDRPNRCGGERCRFDLPCRPCLCQRRTEPRRLRAKSLEGQIDASVHPCPGAVHHSETNRCVGGTTTDSGGRWNAEGHFPCLAAVDRGPQHG